MTQIVSISKQLDHWSQRDFVSWFVFQATTALKDNSAAHKALFDKIDPSKLEIEFKINGVELPFEATLYEINSHIDKMVEEKARDLLKERCSGLIETLDSLNDAVKTKIREQFPNLSNED